MEELYVEGVVTESFLRENREIPARRPPRRMQMRIVPLNPSLIGHRSAIGLGAEDTAPA